MLQHRNHRHETIGKAIVQLQVAKQLREANEQTRPLCQYAEHSIERLHEIARGINARCDDIQAQVESYMNRYFEALQAHRNTLLQQISRARESKVELIINQQLELGRQQRKLRYEKCLMQLFSLYSCQSFRETHATGHGHHKIQSGLV